MKSEITLLSYEEFSNLKKDKSFDHYYLFNKSSSLFSELVGKNIDVKSKSVGLITSTRDVNEDGEVCLIEVDKFGKNELIPIKDIVFTPIKLVMKNVSKNPYFDLESILCDNLTFDFGSYPYDEYLSLYEIVILNRLFKKDKLKKTGKVYKIGEVDYPEYKINLEDLQPKRYRSSCPDYKRFIRFVPDNTIKIDGIKCKKKKTRWINVDYIGWQYIKKYDMAISTNNRICGIPFTDDNKYNGIFEETYLYKFLNEEFAKEILHVDYYNLEKTLDRFDLNNIQKDDQNDYNEIKKICIDLVRFDWFKGISDLTYNDMVNKLKEIYPNLDKEIYKNIINVMMSLSASYMSDSEVIENRIKEKKEQIEQERIKQKEEERLKLIQEEEDSVVNDIKYSFSNKPSNEEIMKYVYTKKPGFTNNQLNEIIRRINEDEKYICGAKVKIKK